jgi:hypothetical protein
VIVFVWRGVWVTRGLTRILDCQLRIFGDERGRRGAPAACWRRGARGWLAGDLLAEVDYELVEGLCCWLRWNAATQYNVMPRLDWLPGECSKSHPRRSRAREIRTWSKPRFTGTSTPSFGSSFDERLARLAIVRRKILVAP